MRRKGSNTYPTNWAEIARQVKEEHAWTCERCGAKHSPEDGFTLTIHHLDMNKANNALWNLACLCQRCHLVIQNRVDIYQGYMFEHTDWMKPHVEGMIKVRIA